MRKLLLGLLLGLSVTACGMEAEDEEAVSEDAQEVSAGRCASVSAPKTARIKVLTLNLRHDSDQWERRFDLIADEIVRLDPDLIGLQEVEIGKDQADKLNDRIARRGHAKYKLYTKRKSGFTGFFTGEGVGIMSRWDMVEKHHEDLGEMRISLWARIKHPSGGFIDFANTHLHNGAGEEADANRDDQARQTLDLINRNDDCYPTFLTGDMNNQESAPAIKRFVRGGLVDSYKQVHGADTARTGATSPIKLEEGARQDPKRRIDFVFGRSAGKRTVTARDSDVVLKNHDREGFYPSDHLAVMTTYDVKL